MERLVAVTLFFLGGWALALAVLPYVLAGYVLYFAAFLMVGIFMGLGELAGNRLWRWRRRHIPDAPVEACTYDRKPSQEIKVGDHVLNNHLGLGEVTERREHRLVVNFISVGPTLISSCHVKTWGERQPQNW